MNLEWKKECGKKQYTKHLTLMNKNSFVCVIDTEFGYFNKQEILLTLFIWYYEDLNKYLKFCCNIKLYNKSQ